MTEEQIIKGAEQCFLPARDCKECPYQLKLSCIDALVADILVLIKRQKTEREAEVTSCLPHN